MAKVEATQATKTLAGLAKPGAHIPESRYDQFIRKPEHLNHFTTPGNLFSTALLGLGFLDKDSILYLQREAVRLNSLNRLNFHEANELLVPEAEIVVAYNALSEAIAARYNIIFDDQLLDSRKLAFVAVATAGYGGVELCRAS